MMTRQLRFLIRDEEGHVGPAALRMQRLIRLAARDKEKVRGLPRGGEKKA